MLRAIAVLIFVAATDENTGGKETLLYKQEFGKQPPNCFAYTPGGECCFPLDITYHSIYRDGSRDETAKAKLHFLLGIGII